LIGPGLLITPVLTQGATSVKGYFPPASPWYSFWDGTPLSGSGWVTLDTPMEDIQVHVRGGVIFPMQGAANTTKQGRATPFQLLVALDTNGNSQGSLFYDDGVTLDIGTQATRVSYNVTSGTLTATVLQATQPSAPPSLGTITVLGVKAASTVTVNGSSVSFSFNVSTGKLTIPNLSLSMVTGFTVKWG